MESNQEIITPPTWQLNEKGQAVATLDINGVPTDMIVKEPTMNTMDAMACWVNQHPGSVVKAMLVALADTLVEPKMSFEDLCALSMKEGKEVCKALRCFPDYAEG